ncbi:MAG: MBL fold metallo-hydrolase [Bryobacteraceae bacterium]|nr:MBL fold metallo-hydrolase [Bryobacteraceae bacterium]
MRPFILLLIACAAAQAQPGPQIKDVKVRILSTMLADEGIGEWGFAAVVEADGRRILFDTGARPETVLRNAQEMGVDLASITDVILSHNHGDHTGGLLTLRRELRAKNANALSRAHVGKGIFLSRAGADGAEHNYLRKVKADYEALGGTFIEYAEGRQLFPGAWFTGPVKRTYPEKNWSTRHPVHHEDGTRGEDNLPEDSSLVLDTGRGLVIIAGCGHAGIINTLEQARRQVRNAPVHAAIGGFHLFNATDQHLEWTAGKLKEMGLENFLGSHCTGIEAVYKVRQLLGLARRNCAVGAVGGGFTLSEGLKPGAISR